MYGGGNGGAVVRVGRGVKNRVGAARRGEEEPVGSDGSGEVRDDGVGIRRGVVGEETVVSSGGGRRIVGVFQVGNGKWFLVGRLRRR